MTSSSTTGHPPVRRTTTLPAIMDAARDIFVERGYHGASIRDIAARAGTSLSALYYWHSGKQDLLAALLAESRRDYVEACRTALAETDPDDAAAALAAIVDATVRYRVRRRAESALSAQEWRHLEPRHLEQLDQYRQAASRLWTDVIERGRGAGVFHAEHLDDARRSVQAACNAVAEWYDPGGSVTVDELARRYVCITLRIVDHRPPT